MHKINFGRIIIIFSITTQLFCDDKLTGKIISSDENSKLLNNAFDGNFKTFFKSEKESNCYIGLDLSTTYLISKIGWSQNESDKSNYLLGIFEGSNEDTFLDSYPLYMITSEFPINTINYITINTTKTFRYVRYIGPDKKYCIISNLEFYGTKADLVEDSKIKNLYQPTKLPLFVINTAKRKEPAEDKKFVKGYIYTIDKGLIDNSIGCQIKLRGNSSIKRDKKPYRVKLNEKRSIFNSDMRASNWLLIANYADKTLIRDELAYNISRAMEMAYTIDCWTIELIFNGNYKGTYELCEQIDTKKNKLNIVEMKNTYIKEPEISGGYLLEVDGYAYLETSMFISEKGVPITVQYPEEDEILLIQRNYIKDKFNELEREVYGYNITNIDNVSFIKYFLIGELTGNPDSYWSVNIYKNFSDPKFYFGPVWDFDSAFDNDYRVYPINSKEDFLFNYGLSAGTMVKFVSKILKKDIITEGLKTYWESIRKEKITKDKLFKMIDDKIIQINESQRLNFIRWDILNKKVAYNPVAMGSYENEIKYMKNYLEKRIEWLDNYFSGNATVVPDNNTINKKLEYDINVDDENEKDYEFLDGGKYKFIKSLFVYINLIIFCY